jgi:hypothetical protein
MKVEPLKPIFSLKTKSNSELLLPTFSLMNKITIKEPILFLLRDLNADPEIYHNKYYGKILNNFHKYKIIEKLESLDMFDSQALMEIDKTITPTWTGNNKHNKIIYRRLDCIWISQNLLRYRGTNYINTLKDILFVQERI